jgi:hypothetical protein
LAAAGFLKGWKKGRITPLFRRFDRDQKKAAAGCPAAASR